MTVTKTGSVWSPYRAAENIRCRRPRFISSWSEVFADDGPDLACGLSGPRYLPPQRSACLRSVARHTGRIRAIAKSLIRCSV